MVREIDVRLVARTNEAANVLRSFSNQVDALARQAQTLTNANRAIARAPFAGAGVPSDTKDIRNIRTEYQSLGNTIKQLSTITVQLAKDDAILSTQVVDYRGDLERLTAANLKYGQAVEQEIAINQRKEAQLERLEQRYNRIAQAQQAARIDARSTGFLAQGRIDAADERIIAARTRTQTLRDTLGALQADQSFRQSQGETISGAERQKLQQAHRRLQQAIEAEARVVTRATAEKQAAQRSLAKAQADEVSATRAAARAESTKAALTSRTIANANARISALGISQLEAEVLAARNAPPPIPAALQTVRRESPQLTNILGRAGLGAGTTGSLGGNIAAQGAADSFQVQRDLVRNVTRVTGSFLDQKGVLNTISAEYDRAGNVITRFGGRLSGLNNVLRQVGRDFQKVAEFALATTAIFGGIQLATQTVTTINELDKSVRQFGITANLTREEAREFFNELAVVGFETATPLTEIVKAADDIALATRRAGQSTEEWHREILDLTKAVGILTNLAGIDTVRATDLLTSTMKQLGLEADQLLGIENKITAVAGGQSTAIADIIEGLGQLAEAGSQAGLSIDEMIATVQVLSQVTAKTPSQVATALKNLIGSVDSVGAKKVLEEFDIALRETDESGAVRLRNIVEIYTEISDKINQGIIPADRVKEFVKAIAGGPRRAPDAAALLSAVGQIEIVSERSQNATNEAIIANAKLLDSTQAKLVQFGVIFEQFAFNKFADALNSAAGNIAQILTVVLNILNQIPTGVFTLILQVGALTLAFKLLFTAGGFIVGMLRNVGTTSAFAASEVAALAAATKAAGATQLGLGLAGGIGPTGVAGRAGRFGGRLGGALAIGGAAATGLIANQAFGPEGASNALAAAGTAALLAPLPIPHIKLAGAAMLVLSGAISLFSGNMQTANQEIQTNVEGLLNAISVYNDSNNSLERLTSTQADLAKTIRATEAENAAAPSEDRTAQLQTFYEQYADITVQIINQNKQLKESFDEINKLAPSVGQRLGLDQLQAQAGRFNTAELQKYTQKLSEEIFKQTNPNFQVPDNLITPTNTNFLPLTGSTQVRPFSYSSNSIPLQPAALKFDLTELEQQADRVKELFTPDGSELSATFEPTLQNLNLIQNALLTIKGTVDETTYSNMTKAFEAVAAQADTLKETMIVIAQQTAYLDAGAITGLFSAEEVERGKTYLDIYKQLIDYASTLPSLEGITDPGTLISQAASGQQSQEEILNLARSLFEGGTIDVGTISREQGIGIADAIIARQGLNEVITEGNALEETRKAILLDLGIVIAGYNEQLAEQRENEEALAEAEERRNEALNNAQSAYASRSADLQARENSGEFEDNAEGLQFLRDQNDQVYESTVRLINAFQELTIDTEQFQEYAGALTGIVGLQDAATLTSEQLALRIGELAIQYGLSGKQTDLLTQKILNLVNAMKTVDGIQATFHLKGDSSSFIAQLKAMRATIAAMMKSPFLTIQGATSGFSSIAAIDKAIQELLAAQNISTTSVSQANNIIGSGAGSNAGQLPSGGGGSTIKPQGPDVSTVDIPDAIANAYNRDALIQEAIRRAKALQAKIPGAAAEAKNDIVELLKGTQHILEVRGVKDDLLRRALEELAEIEKKRLEFETKADTIRRIRVGTGSFAAIANVPVNTQTGVSLGGAQGPINVTLNLNGTVLTPAQLAQFADLVAAALKRQIANG